MESCISLFCLPVAALLLPAVWLAPIKLPLQAAQFPNTFKSHKIQQSTIPYQAKTIIWRLQQGHAENSNGDKVVLDTVCWMNDRSCKWLMSQMNTGVQKTSQGLSQDWGPNSLAGWWALLPQPENNLSRIWQCGHKWTDFMQEMTEIKCSDHVLVESLQRDKGKGQQRLD